MVNIGIQLKIRILHQFLLRFTNLLNQFKNICNHESS